jgi:integrase
LLNRIQKQIKPVGYVFFNPKTKRPFVEISSAWGTLLKKAKIYDLTFHDLRGVFAANFLLRDHDLLSLQGVLGHKNIQTTMRYVQPHWKSMEKSVNDLGKNFSNMNTDYSIAKLFHSTENR